MAGKNLQDKEMEQSWNQSFIRSRKAAEDAITD